MRFVQTFFLLWTFACLALVQDHRLSETWKWEKERGDKDMMQVGDHKIIKN